MPAERAVILEHDQAQRPWSPQPTISPWCIGWEIRTEPLGPWVPASSSLSSSNTDVSSSWTLDEFHENTADAYWTNRGWVGFCSSYWEGCTLTGVAEGDSSPRGRDLESRHQQTCAATQRDGSHPAAGEFFFFTLLLREVPADGVSGATVSTARRLRGDGQSICTGDTDREAVIMFRS